MENGYKIWKKASMCRNCRNATTAYLVGLSYWIYFIYFLLDWAKDKDFETSINFESKYFSNFKSYQNE